SRTHHCYRFLTEPPDRSVISGEPSVLHRLNRITSLLRCENQPVGVACSFALRGGGPRKAGTTKKAATSVKNSEIARSLPMLAVPGWDDSMRLPKAVPVVREEKKIARVRLEASISTFPLRQAMT